jgi:hypothetical protein
MFIKFMNILTVYFFMISMCFCAAIGIETSINEFNPFKKIDHIDPKRFPEDAIVTSPERIEDAKRVDPSIDSLLDEKAAFVGRLFKGEENSTAIDSLSETTFIDGLKRLRQISNSGNLSNQINALVRKRALKKEGKYIIIEDFSEIISYLKRIKDSKDAEEDYIAGN